MSLDISVRLLRIVGIVPPQRPRRTSPDSAPPPSRSSSSGGLDASSVLLPLVVGAQTH